MADTRRATTGVDSSGLGFAGDPRQSTAISTVYQERRKHPSIDCGTLTQSFVPPLYGLELLNLPFEWIFAGLIIVVLLGIIRARGRANKRLAQENGELAADLQRCERKAKESEAALKHQIASLLEVPSQEPLRKVGAKVRLVVPPDGSEVFLPLLDLHRVYQITVHGKCKFSESVGWFSSRDGYADALYHTDEIGNFAVSHDCLKLEGVPIRRFMKSVPPETMVEEDRKAHRYRFRIDGTTKKISARFLVEFEDLEDEPNGSLTLTVEVLPEGTPSPIVSQRREEAARRKIEAVDQLERAAASRAIDDAKKAAAIHATLESLRLRAHCESHFLIPEFQQDFAKHNPTEILNTKMPEWRKQYAQFMQDASLKSLAEEQAPEVIQWFEARVKIAQLAEQAIVAPPPAFKEMSAEEAEAKMIREKTIEHRKKIALAKLKGERVAEANAVLESLPLEGDLKERLKTELTDSILDEGENERRKTNVTL